MFVIKKYVPEPVVIFYVCPDVCLLTPLKFTIKQTIAAGISILMKIHKWWCFCLCFLFFWLLSLSMTGNKKKFFCLCFYSYIFTSSPKCYSKRLKWWSECWYNQFSTLLTFFFFSFLWVCGNLPICTLYVYVGVCIKCFIVCSCHFIFIFLFLTFPDEILSCSPINDMYMCKFVIAWFIQTYTL